MLHLMLHTAEWQTQQCYCILPSDDAQHDVQRWSPINIPLKKEERPRETNENIFTVRNTIVTQSHEHSFWHKKKGEYITFDDRAPETITASKPSYPARTG